MDILTLEEKREVGIKSMATTSSMATSTKVILVMIFSSMTRIKITSMMRQENQ
jgi:hypothetical protein